jgi:hypothetical protein
MPYSAYSTAGLLFQLKIASTYTTVPGIESIDGPGGDKAEIDVTALDDVAAKKVTGFPDYGTITLNGFYDPADTVQEALRTLCVTANATGDIKLTLPDAGDATIEFTGCQFKNWRWSFAKNDAMKFSCEVVANGAPTITP